MDILKFTYKSIIFACLLVAMVLYVDPFFLKNDNNYYKYNLFYEHDDIGILVLGNSHADSGINHKILKARSGLTSYNLSFERTNIFQTYFNLLEALRVSNPKLVIIENHAFMSTGIEDNLHNKNGKMNFKSAKSLYGKRISLVKYNEAKEMFDEDALFNTFNIFRFHDNWTDREDLSQFLYKTNSKSHQQSFNGYATKTTFLSKRREEKIKNAQFDKKAIISEDEKTYLNKIIQLSKERNFDVLFVTIPFLNDYYHKTKPHYAQAYVTLDSIVSKHSNVKRLDLNAQFDFNSTYFIDEKGKNYRNQHLNYKGSTKATNFIADFIASNFKVKANKGFRKSTIEDYAYQNVINNDGVFEGSVTKINNKVFRSKKEKPVVVSDKSDWIKIEGWLRPKQKILRKAQKFVILKGDDNYIYVSLEQEIEPRKTPLLIKKKGTDYDGSGYSFKVQRQTLERGEYEIFHGILTRRDSCFLENTNKKLLIE